MISVVLATYNSCKYLKEQLDSLKQQSKLPDELIVYDDCSTDNTIDLVKEFSEKNNFTIIKIFSNDNNLGYVKTFSKAIKEASGDLIFLCDHDDIWYPNKIEVMSNICKNNSKILALASSFTKIDGKGNEIVSKKSFFTSNHGAYKYHLKENVFTKVSLYDQFAFNITPGCCLAFKKELKKEVLKGLNIAPHDYFIATLAASKNGLYFINIPTIKYRLHDNNTIGIPNINSIESRSNLANKHFQYKNDIYLHLEHYNISTKYKKYMYKHIKIVSKRNQYLEERKKMKLLLLCFKTKLKGRFFLAILKDLSFLINSRKE